MRANLTTLLDAARAGRYAVPAFNVFGFEDALAVVREAQSRAAPVILATNRETVEMFGLAGAVGTFGPLAAEASVPVCLHLDHCHDVDLARRAVDAGYDSVMYDGSQLPFAENVAASRAVAAHAHAAGVGVEGEIGSVAYDPADNRGREHIRHELTEPDVAERFVRESGVDAVAVSVGNVHRLAGRRVAIDRARLDAIAARVRCPLVIHGASGIEEEEIAALAATAVCKLNIGTALRRRFGRALREALAADPHEHDRLTIFARVIPALAEEAGRWLELLGASGKATIGREANASAAATPSAANGAGAERTASASLSTGERDTSG